MDKNNRKERPDGKRTAELRLTIEKLEREIEECKQAEGILRDSQRVSSTLISNLPGMVYRCLNNRDWTVTYISDGCAALTGYPPRDFIENRITYGRLIRPDDQDGVWTMVQAAIRDKKPFTLTYRITAADGEEKWVWEQGRGVFASDGELLFLEGFVTDITKRKQAEEALQAFRVLLDHVWDSIEVFDPHTGRFMDGNEKAWSSLGYARHEFLSLSVSDIDPLVTQATFARNMQRLRETGKELLLDSIHRRKDGTTFPVEVSVQLVRYDKEKEYAVAIVRDITARKQMETALRESEERLTHALDATTEGVWDWNIPTGEVLYSPRWMASLGYSPEEVPPHVSFWESVVHPEDMPRVRKALHDHWEGRTPFYECENRLRTKAGEWRHNLDRGRVVEWDAAGKPLRMVGTDTDITARKQVEEALRASETELRALFAAMTDVVLVLDFQGRYMQIAPTNPALLYKSPTELLGKTIHEVLPKENADLVLDCILRVLKTGQPFNVEYSLHIHDAEVWFDGRVSPLSHNTVFWIARDITERKRVEAALRRSERHMAVLSHRLIEVQETERKHIARELHDEIGQCLTGLKLGLETALRLRESESRTMLLQMVEQVDSLISRSRELSLDLRPAMLDDMGLLPALLFHFERFMKQFGLHVRFEHRKIEGRLHPCLETAVFRIVQEALTNVVRHAQAEEAMVTIMADEDGLTVQVKDEGVGFDPDKIIASGKAMGLSGIRERAILLGGHCDVESAPGAGTQVRVRFPFSEMAKREAEPRAEMEEHD